jgi:hypothetical protein
MAQNIRLRRTNVSGRTGADANLLTGELAMNTADGLLWGKGEDLFEIITENRVYSTVSDINKVVTEAEISDLIQDFSLDRIATYVPSTLPTSQTFTGDGVTTNYTLSATPATPDAIDVYVDDVLQRADEVYTVSGDVLVFLIEPHTGADIFIKYRYPFATIVDLPESVVTNEKLKLTYTSNQYTANGTQRIFNINPGHNVHSVLVIVNGLVQPPNTYTINGTTLTFLTEPASSATVDIRYMPVNPTT